MVDHPLVADNLRRYIQRHKIEESLNIGLNEVLEKLPQDPFSELAASLIDVREKFPPYPYCNSNRLCKDRQLLKDFRHLKRR